MELCLVNLLLLSGAYSYTLNRRILNNPIFNINSITDKDAYHSNIKLLRISTGLGTAECAEALKKTDNDVRKAIALLSNVEYDSKSSSGDLIPLYEGVSTSCIGKRYASIIELRCQSSFVGCNSLFGNLAASIASAIVAIADENSTKSIDYKGIFQRKCLICGDLFEKTVNYVKRSLKEPILFTRYGIIENFENSYFSTYSHKTSHSCPVEVGPSTSLLSFSTTKPYIIEPYDISSGTSCIIQGKSCIYHQMSKLIVEGSEFARDIATHIVAASPTGLSFDDLGEAYNLEKERLMNELSSSGKPPELIDKIVNGRLRKQFAETLLLEQEWSSENITTRKVIENYNKKTNDEFKINSFIVFNVKDDMLFITNKSDKITEINSINLSL